MKRIFPVLVVIGVALSGVMAATRRRFKPGHHPSPVPPLPLAADQPVADRAVADGPVADQPDRRGAAGAAAGPPTGPVPRRRALDQGAAESERIRAAWAYVPATSAAVTDPPARSRRLAVLAALGVLAGIVALGLAMRPPTGADLAGPSPRALAGFESTPAPSPTVAPATSPSPTVRPATTASSTQFAPVSIPDDTVRAYYARAAAHEYPAAAALWFSATGQPVGTEHIERRFAATQAITVSITEVVFQGPSLATVAARIEEVTATATDRYEVLWQLVNVNGRWLLENALR